MTETEVNDLDLGAKYNFSLFAIEKALRAAVSEPAAMVSEKWMESIVQHTKRCIQKEYEDGGKSVVTEGVIISPAWLLNVIHVALVIPATEFRLGELQVALLASRTTEILFDGKVPEPSRGEATERTIVVGIREVTELLQGRDVVVDGYPLKPDIWLQKASEGFKLIAKALRGGK